MDVEVLLNSRREVLTAMENEGIVTILGDVVMSDSDPLLLV